MGHILLFLKDFELGTKISSACVDQGYSVDFSMKIRIQTLSKMIFWQFL